MGVQAKEETTVESVAADAAAAVHRGWINVKSAFTGGDDSAILSTCETGEETALTAYDQALQVQDLNQSAKSVLQQQRNEIQNAKSWLSQHK